MGKKMGTGLLSPFMFGMFGCLGSNFVNSSKASTEMH